MPATKPSSAEAELNIIRVAEQAAEAALCHYAYVNGVTFSDEQFAREKGELQEVIELRIRVIESRMDW